MIHLTRAVDLAQDGKPHSFKFVSKGTKKTRRKGGYIVEMKNAKVTSSNHDLRKMNIRSLESNEIRWCYYVLLLEIDGLEIIV